jgi:hypothetical protein
MIDIERQSYSRRPGPQIFEVHSCEGRDCFEFIYEYNSIDPFECARQGKITH